jgi:lysophospholipase L1-like esterase
VRARWRVVLLLLAAVLAALALGEALVRALAPQATRPAWDDEIHGIRVPRPGIVGRHRRPGKFDVSVSINGQRFRGAREYSPEAPPGVMRLAVLGDSFAFGWGVGDEETYPALLEQALELRLAPRRFEVLNAGFPGTCLGEKAAWYELGVKRFAPRIVVLTALGDDVDGDLYWRVFSLDASGRAQPSPSWGRGPSDPSPRRARSLFRRLPGYEWLIERSQLFGLVRNAVARLVLPPPASTDWASAGAEQRRVFREQGLPLLEAELRWLAERVAGAGGALAVVFLPFRESVYPEQGAWADDLRWRSQAQVAALHEACAALGLPFKDATEHMQARARAEPAVPLYHDGADTHPTAAGYRAIAESVASWLADTGVFAGGEERPTRLEKKGKGTD